MNHASNNVVPTLFVLTQAEVPGLAGAGAALIVAYDQMQVGQFCLVDATGAVYQKTRDLKYASGGRITLIASAAGGSVGVDGSYTNVAGAVAVGDMVYISGAGSVARAQANATGTMPAIGMVTMLLSTTACLVREVGEVTPGGALVAQTEYFVSAAIAGAITAVAPAAAGNVRQPIGRAKTAAILNVQCGANNAVLLT